MKHNCEKALWAGGHLQVVARTGWLHLHVLSSAMLLDSRGGQSCKNVCEIKAKQINFPAHFSQFNFFFSNYSDTTWKHYCEPSNHFCWGLQDDMLFTFSHFVLISDAFFSFGFCCVTCWFGRLASCSWWKISCMRTRENDCETGSCTASNSRSWFFSYEQ